MLRLAPQQRHRGRPNSPRKNPRKSGGHQRRNHRVARKESEWRFFGRSRHCPSQVRDRAAPPITGRTRIRLCGRVLVHDFTRMSPKNGAFKRRLFPVLRRIRLLLQGQTKRFLSRMGNRQRCLSRYRFIDRERNRQRQSSFLYRLPYDPESNPLCFEERIPDF